MRVPKSVRRITDPVLERHVRWNRARNVRVHRMALGSFAGEAAFGGGTGPAYGGPPIQALLNVFDR